MFDSINQSVTQKRMVCIRIYRQGTEPAVITLTQVCLGCIQEPDNIWCSQADDGGFCGIFYFSRGHSSAGENKHGDTNTVTHTMNESVPKNSINLNNNSEWGKCVKAIHLRHTGGVGVEGWHYMYAGTVHKAKRSALKMQIKYGVWTQM